jgi:hypothetical protein
VVSEPIGDLPGAWVELPEASYGVVGKGSDQLLPFTPKPPSKARLRGIQLAGASQVSGPPGPACWPLQAR